MKRKGEKGNKQGSYCRKVTEYIQTNPREGTCLVESQDWFSGSERVNRKRDQCHEGEEWIPNGKRRSDGDQKTNEKGDRSSAKVQRGR